MEMTLEQAAQWMQKLENSGKWGWAPEMKKIMSMFKKEIRAAFTRHKSPAGRQWKKTRARPDRSVIHIGREMRIGRRAFTIRTMPEAEAVARFYNKGSKNRTKFIAADTGKTIPPQHALYNRNSKRMRERMAGKRGTRGHIEKSGRFFLEIGGRGVSLVRHNRGYPARNIEKRTFLEVTPEMVKQVEEVFFIGFQKRLEKGLF